MIENIRGFESWVKTIGADTEDSQAIEESKAFIENYISEMTSAALEMDPERIDKLDASPQFRFDLKEAQSKMYGAALSDPKIRGIGFSEEEDYPIPRNDFARRAVPPQIVPDGEVILDFEWVVSEIEIKVTSPNFDRDDQEYRKWKGLDPAGHAVLFTVLDDRFWSSWKLNRLNLSEPVRIFVQLASRVERGRVKERRVLRIISVNAEKIAPRLSQDELLNIIGMFRSEAAPSKDLPLFGATDN